MAIEEFARNYQYTILMVGVLGTLGAVVVALWANRANRTRIKASADIGILFEQCERGHRKHRYLTVAVANLGQLPVAIPEDFFEMRLLFGRKRMWVVTADENPEASYIPRAGYPVDIQPRKSSRFIVYRDSSFVGMCLDLIGDNHFLRCVRLNRLRIYVTTADGVRVKAKLPPALRSYLLHLPRRPSPLLLTPLRTSV